MNKIIFIANNNIGTGLSGGDSIFIQFIKNWQNKLNITIFGSQESQNLIEKNKIHNLNFIKTDHKNNNPSLTFFNIINHQLRRTSKGIVSLLKNSHVIKSNQYVYSVSDFYPDLLPALIAKLLNPKIKWLAGFYLFAPNPFDKNSPYNQTNQFFKGLIYFLFQQPAYFLVKTYADVVLVTSLPDSKKFSQKTIVVKGGVDFDELKNIKPIPLTKRKYHAVFMGRLHPQKGVLELIDIWKIVITNLPNAKLAIIGDGQLKNQIKEKINILNLNKNIDMLGFLTGSKKYQIFTNSKIVLHPATYDSGGMSSAEAMALGLPLVCYDLKSLKNYYPVGALKTKRFSKIRFAKNIETLLKNKSLYNQLSIEAKQLTQSEWNWQNRSIKIYNLLFSKYISKPLSGI